VLPPVTFDLHSVRFHFIARDPIAFPPERAGNILRGALGLAFLRNGCKALFEPASLSSSPSGLADRPRQFVIRARHLSGRIVQPAQQFSFDVHLFDAAHPPVKQFRQAFADIAAQGFGPLRGKADLVSVEQSPVTIPLESASRVSRLRVEFVSPTALKSRDEIAAKPEFSVLFARARDRVSSLRALYGAGPLEIDFRGFGERSGAVRLARCEVQQVEVTRRSSRTGQRHGIGGFVGAAEYEGDLGEFLPILQAARWTGVGRHCSWGNGEIHTEVIL